MESTDLGEKLRHDYRRLRLRPGGRAYKETHGSTTTDCYFDHSWQPSKSRQSSTVTNQYVWSQAYIDGLVLRDDNSTNGSLGISGSGLGEVICSAGCELEHHRTAEHEWGCAGTVCL